MWIGGQLTLWIGPTAPVPVSPGLLASLEQVQVTHNDTGRSGFQLTFAVARDRQAGLLDYPPLLLQQLRAGFRVLLVTTLNGRPRVLMDGIITNHQLAPSAEPAGTRLTVTGEDVSVMMDLHEQKLPYPAMADATIATTILARYGSYGVVPMVIPHPSDSPPAPTDQVPTRDGTDLAVLNAMAQKWGYVFYVSAGPAPGMNTAYWGPPTRSGIPQRALTFGMGAATNLGGISFTSDANKPKLVVGLIQDEDANATIPVLGLPAGQPLAALPAWIGNAPYFGSKQLGDDHGGDVARAFANATAEATASQRDALTASGELDVGRYGDVLEARGLVDVRGVGLTFDGTWYVKSVTHAIARGSYKQSFNLERDGTLPLTPMVRV